ncbi:hypothetical protein ABNC92_10740 [Paenibacillus larvae]|uniref:Uncharacterized protein n=4 Tax=Halcyonevirus TaxID=2843388 RepID=A0A345ASL2_9CAUD|nr:hypothetical protein [Paenibacillus larvae]YP_009210583.1 hypothetical protein TRIPP_63 [Paenibacillus phage Tripp]YP_010082222.1 hypothetical protein KMD17_gp55 [Paenibacillus phage C7Cdelta]AXF39982.1 hypothetical protein ASH_55 [Paenibacillus phage Ash]AXF40269.1 hypothetical protein LEY_55 [Paenibacillus phage Ley]ALH46436.1 hypothetical protein TRIPP_63 [Paenibacillus phage Tripp]AXF39816.1 hypothetical protein C7CDELTA_55 [Paenibacillus phage C7Cdelta]ETK28008.1 hypothetical protein
MGELIKIDGVIYREANDWVKEGDYVVFHGLSYEDIGRLAAGKPYKVINSVEIGGYFTIEDNYGDRRYCDYREYFTLFKRATVRDNPEVIRYIIDDLRGEIESLERMLAEALELKFEEGCVDE